MAAFVKKRIHKSEEFDLHKFQFQKEKCKIVAIVTARGRQSECVMTALRAILRQAGRTEKQVITHTSFKC